MFFFVVVFLKKQGGQINDEPYFSPKSHISLSLSPLSLRNPSCLSIKLYLLVLWIALIQFEEEEQRE